MKDNEEYSKACVEVLEIIKEMEYKEKQKIPRELKEKLRKNKNLNYKFYIDKSKKLKEQKILDITKAILANIYKEYLATDYEKKIILEKENKNRIDGEKNKIKYGKDIIFRRK